MHKKVILDVDTGSDDAVAIMVAALSPDLELVGVSTVNGNVRVTSCTKNSLSVLDYINAKVPVYQGCPEPMVVHLSPGRRPTGYQEMASSVHGDIDYLPPAHSKVCEQNAVSWLVETYLKSDGDITLIPVGPLTNIAMAIRMEPKILEKIPEIVIMGGGVYKGNITPSAEFNFWVDPEAAKIVMNCGRPIRLVTLDSTYSSVVKKDECQKLLDMGTPGSIASAKSMLHMMKGYTEFGLLEVPDTIPVHDALAVCSVIDPTVVETKFVNVDVDASGGIADGQSVCDMLNRSNKPANVHVGIGADREKFVSMLFDILSNEL